MPTPVLLLRPAPAPAAPVLVKSHPALFRGPESREQAASGDYPKRRLAWRGLTIAVENEAGSLRDWGGGQTRMLFPYGEVMNTEGSDGDPVDCYLGPRLEDAPFVYVVHQNRAGRWDQYDEDKAMLGFLSAEEAAQAYLAHYDDPRFLGPITTMAVDEFVAKVRATRDNPGMIKSWLGGADLLKATIKKTVTVPGYYRKDGTWVPPHTKAVHYNPNHELEAIAGGGVSHSQKQAHAKLSKEEWFHKLDTFDKATHVMAHATDIQDAASQAAAVSGWKAAALAGKNPTAAQWSAFHSLPKEKQGALYDAVLEAGKSFAHLKPLTGHVPGTPAPGTPAWHAAKNATPEPTPEPANKTAEAMGAKVQSIPDPFAGIEQLIADAPKVELDSVAAQDALDQLEKTGSHYQKEALKKLKAGPDWASWTPAVRHAKVMALYKELQGAASKSAAVSLWKKQLLAGKHPSAAQASAFADLMASNPEKSKKLQDEVIGAIGQQKYIELVGSIPHSFDPKKQAAAPASPGEKKSGPAGIPAYDYLAQNKHASPGVKLGADWLQANPGKLSELHAAMQDHGYAGDVIKQAIKNASTFIPAAGPSPMDKQTIDSMVAKEDVEALQSMVNHAKHPEAAAYAKEQLEKLQAAAGPKEGDTKQGADGTLVFKDGRWHKQDAAKPAKSAADYAAPAAASFGISPDGEAVKNAAIHAAAGNIAGIESILASIHPTKVKTKGAVQHILDAAKKEHGVAAPAPAPAPAADSSFMAMSLPDSWSYQAATNSFSGPAGNPKYKFSVYPTATGAGFKVNVVSPKGEVIGEHFFKDAQSAADFMQASNPGSPGAGVLEKLHSPVAKAGATHPHQAAKPTASASLPAGWAPHPSVPGIILTASTIGPYKVRVSALPNGAWGVDQPASGMPEFTSPVIDDVLAHVESLGAAPLSAGVLMSLQDAVGAAPKKPPRVASVKPAAAPSTIGVEAQVFHNTEPGHSKQWAVSVSGSQLITSYGKIGAKQQTTVKDMGSIGSAILQKNKLIDEKKAKGYVYKPGAGVMHQHAAPANANQAVANAIGVALDPPKKPKVLNSGTTFGVAANAVEKYIAEGNPHGIIMELEPAVGFTSVDALNFQTYAIAGLKHLGWDQKPSFVSGADWSGPKDGDMKEGVSGMLVFKDGYWHKVPTSLSNAETQAIIQQHGFSNAGANPNLQQAVTMAMNGNVEALKELKAQVQPGHIKTHGVINSLLAALGHAPAKAASGKVNKLTKTALNKIVSQAKGGAKLSATGKVLIEKAKAAAYEGNVAGVQAVIDDVSGSKLGGTKAVLAAIYHALTGEVAATTGAAGNVTMTPAKPAASPAPASPPAAAPKAAAPAPAAPPKPTPGAGIAGSVSAPKIVSVQEIQAKAASDISGWKKTGNQEGSNEGGYFTDPQGVQWYCKFPKDPAHAASEILASKLYAACGVDVPELKAITRNGKPGIASRVIPLKKASTAALAAADGMKEGFAVDAWLANWDVIGPDSTNTQLSGKKAVRVDVGGSLDHRAQGAKKGAEFGDKVADLETLVGPKNATGKAVFGGMTQKEIGESARKVFALSDASITKLVMSFGPGSVDEKHALADKLIARKKDLAAKFPEVWKDYAPTAQIVIPDAPNFKEWNGPGKGLSSKAHVNEQNQQLAVEIHGLGKKGKVKELQEFKFQPLHKETGAAEGSMQPISAHPSQHIKKYHGDVLHAATTPVVKDSPLVKDAQVSAGEASGGVFGALLKAFDDVKGLLHASHKLGRYALLGRIAGGGLLDGWNPPESSKKNGKISSAKFYSQSKSNYDKLSSIEKQAIKEYTGSGYTSMNNAATGVGTHGKTDYAIGGLNKASVDLDEGTVLSRKFSFTSSEDLQNMLASEGSVIKDFGIISTSLSPHVWHGNVHLRIVCAKGTKGLYVAPNPSGGGGAISSHPGEDEVILPYGTKFFVRKVHPSGTKFTDEHGSWGTGGPVVELVALPSD